MQPIGIEHLRLRKHKSAKIQVTLYDDRTLIHAQKHSATDAQANPRPMDAALVAAALPARKGQEVRRKAVSAQGVRHQQAAKLRELKLFISGRRNGRIVPGPAQPRDEDMIRNLSVAKGFSSSVAVGAPQRDQSTMYFMCSGFCHRN